MDSVTYQQRHLFEADISVAITKPEDQWFDRKSGRIAASDLANELIGFANADGGTLVVGIEAGHVVGIDIRGDRINELRQAALDHTTPPVRHTVGTLKFPNTGGVPVTVLVFEIHPSEFVHRNQRGEVYLRVGDETRRLPSEAARELEYDKGVVQYDGSPFLAADSSDLDETDIERFRAAVSTSLEGATLLRARGLILDRDGKTVVTPAALLLFGHLPQRFFPNAYVRFVRYSGTSIGTGRDLNIVLDRRLEGTLPEQIESAFRLIESQLREFTMLDDRTGKFVVESELPRFAWQETIVNAVTHRSYSLHGDHIRVRMFDDRLEIESPGGLPGPVRIDNIRRTRFSRNPRIARVLADLGFVRELNEGMNRMFREMEFAGLPEPLLSLPGSAFRVALLTQTERSRIWRERMIVLLPNNMAAVADHLIRHGRITTAEAGRITSSTAPTARRYLRELERNGLVIRVGASTSDPTSFWQLPIPLRQIGSNSRSQSERTRKVY